MPEVKFLTLEQADEYARNRQYGKWTFFWEGWHLVMWEPNKRGMTRRDGAFLNDRWGVQRRIVPDKQGRYRISV